MDTYQLLIDQMNEKAWDLGRTNTEQAKEKAYEALDLSIKNGYHSGRAFSFLVLSLCYNQESQYEKALEFAQRAKEIGGEQHLPEKYKPYLSVHLGIAYKNLDKLAEAEAYFKEAITWGIISCNHDAIATAQNDLGNMFQRLGDYITALEYYLQSLEHWEKQNNSKKISLLYNHIASLYEKQNDIEESLIYHYKSLALKEELRDKRGIAHVLNNIGILYGKKQEYINALNKYQEALALYEELNFKEGIAASRSNIADTYISYGDYVKAIPQLLEAIGIFHHIKNNVNLLISLTNLSSAYSKSNQLILAQELLPEIENLLTTVEAKAVAMEIHRDLSPIYEMLGEIVQSLKHYRKFHRLDKEIFNDESDRRLKNLQIIYQVEQMKKEKENAELKAQQLQMEIDFKTKELVLQALHIVQKNNLINNIHNAVQTTLSTLDDVRRKLLKDVISAIRDANIKESDWKHFEKRFLKVYADFPYALAQKHSTLSPAEIKVCILIKLQLSNKEISSLLNIALRTVEFHRLNIRKKLNLPEKMSLVTYLQNF